MNELERLEAAVLGDLHVGDEVIGLKDASNLLFHFAVRHYHDLLAGRGGIADAGEKIGD